VILARSLKLNPVDDLNAPHLANTRHDKGKYVSCPPIFQVYVSPTPDIKEVTSSDGVTKTPVVESITMGHEALGHGYGHMFGGPTDEDHAKGIENELRHEQNLPERCIWCTPY
jgi:hypothetical protein